MTPTSASNKPQSGMTLLELLMALAIMALSASLVATNMRSASPQLSLKGATQQLIADLKKTRLAAEREGGTKSCVLNIEGYSCGASDVERRWPNGVAAIVAGSESTEVILGSAAWNEERQIILRKDNIERRISIERVTGRIVIDGS